MNEPCFACDCTDCRCSTSDVLRAGGCPWRASPPATLEPPRFDDDDIESREAVTGAEFSRVWAGMWAGGTIALIGLVGFLAWLFGWTP